MCTPPSRSPSWQFGSGLAQTRIRGTHTLSVDPELSNSRSHWSNPIARHPSVRAGECRESSFGLSLTLPRAGDGVAGSGAFNGCSAGACLQYFYHDFRLSPQRTHLKQVWGPVRKVAVCKPFCNAEFFEHKHTTNVGSQQIKEESSQSSSEFSKLQKSRVTRARSQSSNEWYNCSACTETDASGDDVSCGCVRGTPYVQFTGSRKKIDRFQQHCSKGKCGMTNVTE